MLGSHRLEQAKNVTKHIGSLVASGGCLDRPFPQKGGLYRELVKLALMPNLIEAALNFIRLVVPLLIAQIIDDRSVWLLIARPVFVRLIGILPRRSSRSVSIEAWLRVSVLSSGGTCGMLTTTGISGRGRFGGG